MPPAKLERADEGEIRRRWAALDLPKRQAAMYFEDPGLITCIRNAVQNLFQKQVMMAKLGMWQGHESEPDLLLDSVFLKDIFDLHWIVEKSPEFEDAVLMNPEIQPALMTLKPAACEGCVIFDCLRLALPDFLGSKTGRGPLPRARWKQLWAVEPSSVGAFEQQLAKLAEQALWALGLNHACEARREESRPQAHVEVEDWMLESTVPLPPNAGSKSKKKKHKSKKHGIASNSEVLDSEASVQPQDVDEKEADMEVAASCLTCKSGDAERHQEQSSVEEGMTAIDSRPSEPEVLQTAPETVSQTAQEAVAHQYWDWHSDMERTTAFHWCLPSNPFSRGFWSSSRSSARVEGPSAVVRNTFIDIVEQEDTSQSHLRMSRSLSPRYRQGAG
eukprot:TRINITY_DN102600_c0_g1_i1.p1 TRINITY_DN102600_c0_g1~~TRINITY_DN102600_c0_g1_i1.p1  ORF type:complete len:402 (+),score=81.26 TRINITY_DN102600_c0_g1_i1:45-1208(+)